MTHRLRTTCLPVLAVLLVAAPAVAADPPIPTCDQEAQAETSRNLSRVLHRPVITIQELLETGRLDKAMRKLDKAAGLDGLSVYDRAVIAQLYAQLYLDRDEFEDGVRYLEEVVRLGCGLQPLQQIRQMIFNVGQLYIVIGAEKDGEEAQAHYRRGIATLEGWFAETQDARPDAYAVMAVAHLQLDPPDFPAGIEWYDKAIETAQAQGVEPKEGWYRNLANIHLEADQPARALPIMEMLVETYDDRDYWLQLAYTYGELYRDSDQYRTLVEAYARGKIQRRDEYRYLAQLHAANGNPAAAHAVLEDGEARGFTFDGVPTQMVMKREGASAVSARIGWADKGGNVDPAPVAARLDRGSYPKFRVQPGWPRRAYEHSISGCVEYGFTITKSGTTSDIFVLRSSNPMFDAHGIRALRKFRYEPLQVDGESVDDPGQAIRLVWQVERYPLPDHPACGD